MSQKNVAEKLVTRIRFPRLLFTHYDDVNASFCCDTEQNTVCREGMLEK